MTSTYVEEPEIREAEPEFREAEPDFKEAEPMLERTASSATSGADEESPFRKPRFSYRREAEPEFKEAEPMLERTASSATSGADEEARFESQGSVIAGDSFEDHGLLAESPVKEAPPLPPPPVLIQKRS
ncbi:unnamed protein product [Bursaphelenchus okinawaensis]|uniref:Uncharacterized protein n=1 Tax=Bursaphelenchus okinawaensis TaxID=465554 RepID=A0A811LV23_9BILA|nr:unnamed protein product [Bursaphelenchus okinawaensis]CAG9129328.1 unnamed protein product [Bursaphelenchus okinawaensis]